MKKLVCILLTIVTIVSCMSFTAYAKSKYSPYKSIIESALKNATYDNSEYGTWNSGFLYDFDNNGTKELVIQYHTLKRYQCAYSSYCVFSVYTIKNGKAVKIVKNKKMYIDAGGPHGAVGVAKRGKRKYLVVCDEPGGPVSYPKTYYSGKIVYYKIKGSKISTVRKLKYNICNNFETNKRVKSESSFKDGSKKISYSRYNAILKSYKYSYVKCVKDGFKTRTLVERKLNPLEKLLKTVSK